MELADLGSFRDLLDQRAPLMLDCVSSRPEVHVRIALQISEGMAYMHAREPPMLHHDLKSANVLCFSGSDGAASPSMSSLVPDDLARLQARLRTSLLSPLSNAASLARCPPHVASSSTPRPRR